MLRKKRLDDGGIDVLTCLLGPAVFLDVWAVRDFSRPSSEVTRRSLRRTWMPNDGFDIAHLIPALTIGGFIAVDTDWQSIGQSATCELPPNQANCTDPENWNNW